MKKICRGGAYFRVCLMVAAFLIAIGHSGYNAFSKEGGEKNSLVNHINSIRIEKGKSEKNITIFPLTGNELLRNSKILTLDEALEKGGLLIKELEPEDVNRLMVQNRSSEWVFIMAGEILTGSKQDRILKDDLLLPPKSGKIVVNAYCVEKGRWTYNTEKFTSDRTVSNINVRQKARESCAQDKVWHAVSETQVNCGFTPSTGALNETYKAPAVQKNIDDLYAHFKNLPGEYPGMNGVAVVIDDEILCADVFGKKDIFKKLWPKLLKSYLLEACSKGGGESESVKSKDIQRFFTLVDGARVWSSDAPGEGVLMKIESDDIMGSALTFQKELIHSDIFPHSSGKKPVDTIQPIQRRY